MSATYSPDNSSDYENVINKISSWTKKPVYTDTEGAQLRTGTLIEGTISIKKNSVIYFSFNHNLVNTIPL